MSVSVFSLQLLSGSIKFPNCITSECSNSFLFPLLPKLHNAQTSFIATVRVGRESAGFRPSSCMSTHNWTKNGPWRNEPKEDLVEKLKRWHFHQISFTEQKHWFASEYQLLPCPSVLSEISSCCVLVPSAPSYGTAVCPWPPSPWENAVSDRLLTGPSYSPSSSSSSTGLSLGVYSYTAMLLSLTALTFSSLLSWETNKQKKRWSPFRRKRHNMKSRLPLAVWIIPVPSQRKGQQCECSSVDRQTDRRAAGNNMHVFTGRGRVFVQRSSAKQTASHSVSSSRQKHHLPPQLAIKL